jgi:hypothetical protein
MSSPLSNVASLGAVSSPYSSSPWVNLRANDFTTQCPVNATSDAVPTRSSSLPGLRAIFKRTSTGLTGSHRQRAESLKERISEPRVLSLGSISISNLRDAGVASGCALPMGQEESTTNTGDLDVVFGFVHFAPWDTKSKIDEGGVLGESMGLSDASDEGCRRSRERGSHDGPMWDGWPRNDDAG